MSGLLRRGAAAAGRRAFAAAAHSRGVGVAALRGTPAPPAPPLAAPLRARCAAHGAGCRCGLRGFASGASEPKESTEGGDKAEAAEPEPGEEGAPSVEQLLAHLAEKEAALEEHAKQVTDYKDKVLRAHAEMENLRERTKRQSEMDRKFAVQALLKDLLDVADNLRRALQALPPAVAAAAESGTPPEAGEGDAAATANALHQLAVGVSMTDKVLAKALAKHGAVRFDPLGEEFDPASMAALFKVPVAQAGGKKAGTVAMVTKAGYRLNDRVIRPADVGVVQD